MSLEQYFEDIYLITRKRRELDEECLQNMNSKPGSAYRMVKLLR
jgi:hypothetical protein